MTYEIVCMSCGASLYSGFDLRSPGDILKAADYRCKKCGTKLASDWFSAGQAVTGRVCIKCGTENPSDHAYCKKCGTMLT